MTNRYAEDRPSGREPRIVTCLRGLILLLVWVLVGLAAFASWLATAR